MGSMSLLVIFPALSNISTSQATVCSSAAKRAMVASSRSVIVGSMVSCARLDSPNIILLAAATLPRAFLFCGLARVRLLCNPCSERDPRSSHRAALRARCEGGKEQALRCERKRRTDAHGAGPTQTAGPVFDRCIEVAVCNNLRY